MLLKVTHQSLTIFTVAAGFDSYFQFGNHGVGFCLNETEKSLKTNC